MKSKRHLAIRTLFVSLAIWAGLGSGAAFAGAGGPGVGSGKIGTPNTASEVITTSPLVATNGPGFVLEVPTSHVRELLERVRGQGSIQLIQTDSSHVSVRFHGKFAISVSKRALVEGEVRIVHRGERDNTRVLVRRGRLILLQR